MRKMWLSHYHLQHQGIPGGRTGYLLKVQAEDYEEGYADIFPWSEFGDPQFSDIPEMLRQNQRHPLLNQSLADAEADGRARQQKTSLIKHQKLKNHFLVVDLASFRSDDMIEAMDKGFDRFKLKVCRELNQEPLWIKKLAASLRQGSLLRLDANGQGTNQFFDEITSIKDHIEYVEDPFASPEKWKRSWPLAYDQPGFPMDKVNVEYQIIKPAKQTLEDAQSSKVVYSSYLDHPLGMAHAFRHALQGGPQKRDYGLMSHHIYRETDFHKKVITEGPWLSFQEDIGIGFTAELKASDWVAL